MRDSSTSDIEGEDGSASDTEKTTLLLLRRCQSSQPLCPVSVFNTASTLIQQQAGGAEPLFIQCYRAKTLYGKIEILN